MKGEFPVTIMLAKIIVIEAIFLIIITICLKNQIFLLYNRQDTHLVIIKKWIKKSVRDCTLSS